MKGSLWREIAASSQFKGLWYFCNKHVNALILCLIMGVSELIQAWQIGNYGRFSPKCRRTDPPRIRTPSWIGATRPCQLPVEPRNAHYLPVLGQNQRAKAHLELRSHQRPAAGIYRTGDRDIQGR